VDVLPKAERKNSLITRISINGTIYLLSDCGMKGDNSKKRSIVFVISDFLVPPFLKPLQIASGKHDVVAIKVFDKTESAIPDIGFVKVRDPETGKELWADTSSASNRARYSFWWNEKTEATRNTFSRCGVDYTEIGTDEDYVKPLINLFKRR